MLLPRTSYGNNPKSMTVHTFWVYCESIYRKYCSELDFNLAVQKAFLSSNMSLLTLVERSMGPQIQNFSRQSLAFSLS